MAKVLYTMKILSFLRENGRTALCMAKRASHKKMVQIGKLIFAVLCSAHATITFETLVNISNFVCLGRESS